MTKLRAVALAIFDFVVGDDWLVAAGVATTLGLTAIVASAGVGAWWLMPLAVVALLAHSLWRAAR